MANAGPDRAVRYDVPFLLDGIRYPLAAVANQAAQALVALKRTEVVPQLAKMLAEPDPSVPILDGAKKQFVVREVVRVNHFRNCLLCHAPSMDLGDGRLRAPIPVPGQPLPEEGDGRG